jgi:tRNA wybutosine-synthesizing protein 1
VEEATSAPADEATLTATGRAKRPPRAMITPLRRESLEKTYTLVGTHSAVKLCRWQKAMMRGRGGCYKYTFYGIESHRCMEATPSLGCANKCTFCWRLNSNPTIKEWNFLTDEPVSLVDQLVGAHQGLVKGSSGMAGAIPEKVEEAKTPKHCALSLVGEPIVYPRISEFCDHLHRRGISSFLVNNGQFPESIRDLRPITQLYLSVDAANRDDMKRLDRPVFADFWERFQQSIDFMHAKKGRTVFRLTLIEEFNMGDVRGYAEMVLKGQPDMVELKQVTPAFQGFKASPFRMTNVPEWDRVVAFGKALCDAVGGGEYEVAAAHEHSKCLLLARVSKFKRGDAWHTWIDFPKFHALINDPSVDDAAITAEDFSLPTPDWAVFGAPEQGFDPAQSRHVTKKRRAYLEKEAAAAAAAVGGSPPDGAKKSEDDDDASPCCT